jgi:hypothetical protein
VPGLFALAAVGFFIRPLKQMINNEPINGAFVALSMVFLTLAIGRSVVDARLRARSNGPPEPASAARRVEKE